MKTYNKDVVYFGDNGKFQEAEEGVIGVMSQIAADIYTLANCARAGVIDCKNMFYVRCVCMPRYSEDLIKQASLINVDKMGLTQKFVDGAQDLINAVNPVAASNQTRLEKLNALNTAFKNFFDTYDPDTVFEQACTTISGVVGQFSLVSSSIDQDEQNVKALLARTANFFKDIRGVGFEYLSGSQKQAADEKILNLVLA